jgi:hypothetical protein
MLFGAVEEIGDALLCPIPTMTNLSSQKEASAKNRSTLTRLGYCLSIAERGSIDLPNHFTGDGIAGPAPCREFHRVDAAVADLGPVDHRVVHPELAGKVALGQPSLCPHGTDHF